mgnify:CR=1 FL=1
MALSIKNKETEALARELARITKQPITAAVHGVLQQAVERERNSRKLVRQDHDELMAAIRAIQDRVAKLPVLDNRHPDDMLYDEYGTPK